MAGSEDVREKHEEEQEQHDLDEFPVGTNEGLLADIEAQKPASTSLIKTIPPPNARNRSTAYLDGMRGVAALLVMLQHYTPYFYGPSAESAINHGFGQLGPETETREYHWVSLPFVRLVYSGGNMAVAIFFVLSGYVLSRNPIKKIRDGGNGDKNLLSAILRRPIRLYLPPMVTTFCYAVLMHMPFGALRKTHWPEPQPTLLQEINVWFVKFIYYFTPYVNTGTIWFEYSIVVWTLTWELYGSNLVYLTCFVMGRIYRVHPIPPKWTMFALSLLGLYFLGTGSWEYSLFTLGTILSMRDIYDLDLIWPTFSARRDYMIYHGLLIVGLYLSGQPSFMGGSQWAAATPGWTTLTAWTPTVYAINEYHRWWLSLGGALVVISARRLNWLQELLASRPCRYLGQVSFSLYLTHALVYYTFAERLHRMFGQVEIREDEEESWLDNKLWIPDWGPLGLSTRYLVCFSIMLTITLGVSHLGTLYLDQTSVKVGKWVVSKVGL